MFAMLAATSGLAQSKENAEDIPPPPEGTQATDEESAVDEMALENLMREVLQVYLEIQKYLAEDSTWRVGRSAGLIALKVKNFDIKKLPTDFSPLYRTLPKQLRAAARKMYKAKSLADLRLHFKGLSKPMATWANISKLPDIDVIYCPVANATWLQYKGPVRNPYYGSQMLESGQVVWSGPEVATKSEGEDGTDKATAEP